MNKEFRLVIAALFMISCFSYGIYSVRYGWPPYPIFQQAAEAYKANKQQQKEIKTVMKKQSLLKKRRQKYIIEHAHLQHAEPKKIYAGVVAIAAGTDAAMLVDMDGRIMHSWHLPYSSVWQDPPHVNNPNPDDMTRFIDIEVFPNGDLIAIYHADNDTPYGYGMVKMDSKSKLIWKYARNAHHDMYVTKKGKIYTLTHAYETPEKNYPIEHFAAPILTDKISILDKNGNQLEQIPLIEAFLGTPYEMLLYSDTYSSDAAKHDYTHANSVMPLEERMAKAFPQFKTGYILVSLRNLHAIAVIDPTTKKVVWATRGMWKSQHEAQFLDNGHILLFDNQGYIAPKKPRSRLLEFDPKTGAVAWYFTGTQNVVFYSDFHGSQQRLPNGNTLAVETSGGNKVIEITPEKRVIWNYTISAKKDRQLINRLNKAYKISYDFFTPEFCKKIKCNQAKQASASDKPALKAEAKKDAAKKKNAKANKQKK